MAYQDEIDAAAATLRESFSIDDVNHALGKAFIGGLSRSGFHVDLSSPPGMYIEAVRGGFYDRNTQLLPSRYRECAVVALLASQGPDANLGYHLFLALMVGISANDVYDILLLTGVYAGVNRLTTSLKVAQATFDALIDAANAGVKTPAEIFGRIAKACEP